MTSINGAKSHSALKQGFFLSLDAATIKSVKKSQRFRLKKESQNGALTSSTSTQGLMPISLPRFPSITEGLETNPYEPLDTLVCKHCKKTILRQGSKEHIPGCAKAIQEKRRKKKEAREAALRAKERAERGNAAGDDDDDDEDIRDGKSRKVNGNGNKRKAEDDDIGGASTKKKKKKGDDKNKGGGAKPKGPVDVEKQCGVTLPNGAQCARSLTCKSHSMGAKRSVPGRSRPYDQLLQQYQQKNQAKQQKERMDANAMPLDDDDLDSLNGGNVDSDEEKEAVMASIQRSLARPQPIASRNCFSTKRRYQLIRMKEMLSNAVSGNRGGGLFAVRTDTENRGTFPASAAEGGFAGSTLMRPPSRRTSIEAT